MNVEEKSLADRVSETVASGDFELPPLPDVAVKLQALLSNDEVDVGKVVELLMADPAVTATVFRASNSAVYGGLRPITDLRQAVVRLGVKRVGAIVTAMQMKGGFFAEPASNRAQLVLLWNHAIASASVCQWLARREEMEEDEAFMAGLLHGIGRLLVLKAVDVVRRSEPDVCISDDVMSEMMETFQVDLGEQALRQWKLPERLCNSVRAVRTPALELQDRLDVIVQAADRVTRKLEVHPLPDADLVLGEEAAVERLELTDVERATILVDLEDEIAEIRGLF